MVMKNRAKHFLSQLPREVIETSTAIHVRARDYTVLQWSAITAGHCILPRV